MRSGTANSLGGDHMRRVIWITVITLLGALAASPAGATMLGREGKIAFVRHNQIYTMTKLGTQVTQLTTDGKNYRPKWSPNGQKIAYIHESATGRKNVFIMSASGAQQTRVTTSGTVRSAAACSPNGKTLAFAQEGTYLFRPFCYPDSCPFNQPFTEHRTYVFLVRATGPFGAPSMLHVT